MTDLEIRMLLIVVIGLVGTAEIVLTLINVRHVYANRYDVPAFARSYIDRETHKKASHYTLEKGLFSIIQGGFSLIVLLIILEGGFFGYVDRELGEFFRSGYLLSISYLLFLALFSSLLELPFQYYRQFVIEERYGFNTTTRSTWYGDRLKGAILSLCLMTPLLFGLLFFMKSTGEFWWLYAWSFVLTFQLLVLIIYPNWIAPLFNKFTPLEEGQLRNDIFSLSEKLGFSTEGIFIMDGSKRSLHANAYFAGLGSQKRIVLFDTLVSLLTPNQIIAVLAHEIGHEKKRHIVKGVVLFALVSLAAFFTFSVLIEQEVLYYAIGFESVSPHAALIIFSLVLEPISFLLKPIMSLFSRAFEYQADRFAVDAIEGKSDLASALFVLSQNSLSALTPHPLYSMVYYSHPTIGERVQAMTSVQSGDPV